MVRRIFYTLVIIFASMSAAHAQGGVFNDIALNSDGRPMAGATVKVGPTNATGVPLSPTVTTYLDQALTMPASSVTSDSQGNFHFIVAPGLYQVQVARLNVSYTYLVNVGIVASNALFSNRITTVGSGLQILGPGTFNLDAYSGGVNNILTTKTQWQAIRFNVTGRTIGERKGVQGFVNCYGKGDCIGQYGLVFDSGGYLTGGDEGAHGLDGWAVQGVQGHSQTDGGIPTGTVTQIAGDVVTVSWTGGSNAWIGEQRPLIVTSRAVYSTGTIASAGIVGAYLGNICGVTGTATAWGSIGAVGQPLSGKFLNITGNDYTTVKHVVPIVFLTDATHLILEYNLGELGATCFGANNMVTSGAYNVYSGSVVQSLVDNGAGNDPVSVTVKAGEGSLFQVGDTVQMPLGYNFHGNGLQAVISRLIGEPQGQGMYVDNVSPGGQAFRDGFRATGAFLNGITFDGATLPGFGMQFANPVTGGLIRQTDITANTQNILSILGPAAQNRLWTYDRLNDWFVWGGGQYFSATDQRIGIGTTPQPNTLGYVFWNNANWTGLILAPNTAATNNAKPYFGVQLAGTPLFQVEKDRTVINNGMNFKMFSDNETTQKFAVDGATGNVTTPGTLNINGTGALSSTATSGSGSICLTVGCVMTTPNIGAATASSVNASGNVTGGSITATGSGSFGTTFTGPKLTASGRVSGGFTNLGTTSGSLFFDLDTSNTFTVKLNGNVTATSFSNGTPGMIVTFIICQDGSGAHTWTWTGGNFPGSDTIGSTANKCNTQQFVEDSTDTLLYAVAAMKINE